VRIFTVKPDLNDRKAIGSAIVNARASPGVARIWAESALHLDPENLLCWVTCAHVRLILDQLEAAREILVAGIQRHRLHVRVSLLWQNLGVVEGLRGDYEAALEAYRLAARAGALLDRKAALAAVCIVATKLRVKSDLSAASDNLVRIFGDQGQLFLRESIKGRRERGSSAYWIFSKDDVAFLRATAPKLAVSEDWCSP